MTIEQRKKALKRIASLRDAEERGVDPAVAKVREELESDLGGTVTRGLAANFLGVSHTAFNRWVDSGDVPVVVTPGGRREVPIPPLSDLHRRVVHEKESGRRRLHTLEPAMTEARRRAELLQPDPSIRADLESGDGDRHRLSELRGLAYHRALAPRLRRPMVARAQVKLDRWEDEGRIDARHASEWRALLERPLKEIRAAIVADDRRGRDLRQNSPLAGLISEAERRKILETIKLDA
jgi:hypothetical protein